MSHLSSSETYNYPIETIWRYLDICKAMQLFETESLFFCRISSFDDPFEGAIGKRSKQELYELTEELCARHGNEDKNNPKYKDDAKLKAKENLKKRQLVKGTTFANCWCGLSNESEAMWKLYCKDVRYGIVLKSSIAKLTKVLPTEMKINEVEYLDFNQDATFTEEGKEAYTKRDAFIHEQEVRAIYTDRTTKDKGISVKIDLTELVDEIRYSPLAPTKHIDFLKNYFKTKNLNITLTQSELAEEPF